MFRINNIVKNLIISDIFIVGSFGLISPIFAIFITDRIEGGTLEVIGFSWTIYLISKSLTQLPVAGIIDRIKGEKDDFYFVLIFSFLFSFIPLSYIFINSIFQLYFVQFIYGILAGAAIPAWNAIYIRHIDKNHEGLESSVYSIYLNLTSALSAAIGGVIAYRLGFETLFISITLFSLLGTFFITRIYKNLHKITFLDILLFKIKR